MALILVIIAVALALLGGVHYYLWRRLVRDTTAKGSRVRRVGTVLTVVLALSLAGAMVGSRALPLDAARFVAWPGFLWFALMVYLLLALLAAEVVRPVLMRWPRPRKDTAGAEREAERIQEPVLAGVPRADAKDAEDQDEGQHQDPVTGGTGPRRPGQAPAPGSGPDPDPDSGNGTPPDASRRLFVARSVALVAGVAATATVGYGTSVGLGAPRLKRVTVPLAKLDPRAHGFRIAVVSDIHLGPLLGRSHTQRIVDTINRTNPDLVAIVGDLVDGSVAELGPAAEPLARLRAKHGSFFVTGNHEYFSGADEWVDHVRSLGVRPLENERVEIGTFDLAGVNDVAGEDEGQGPDFGKALGDRDPARASVLLAHQPIQIHDAVDHGVDLQLSGHSHGGQMWPGTLLAELANPTVAGLERYGDTQLYVTRGAGFWGPPVRVGAPPDITVVELASPRA